ncbi:MAG TPA: ferredoxin [Candidatus Margulisiibacteriota bacterium]|nr:ferredoxin [Candidatus Margulisiibacteriota bacterium]
MRASVDQQICIGCTLCTQTCAAVFKMEEDKAVAYKNPVPQENHACAQKATEECPVQAITLMP